MDAGIRKILVQRLKDYNGNAKDAFSNLDKNPIWLNEEKGIAVRRVTISGVQNAEPLHVKKDHLGKAILDENGQQQPVDFVSTGNNHHIAIYRDADGNLQEEAVSFYEAVARVNAGQPIINKNHNAELGWKFLFTMKQNEYFLFPSEGFQPNDIELLNPLNARTISPHLFRVQKISTKNYFFRHHLETNVEEPKALKGVTYKPQLGLSAIDGVVKVRLNHIGLIVKVGEY
jgi:CRISPR-associated endonuclease Csn1